jgi:rod shape-determining protein MreD
MRGVGICLLAFLLLALESPLLHRGSVADYTPDLTLLIVLYVGQTSRFTGGLILALSLGLLKDGFALGASPVGMYTEISVLIFLVSHRLARRIALQSPLSIIFVSVFFVIGAALAELVLSLVFVRGFGSEAGSSALILGSMVPQALATAPFGPVIFWLFDRLDGLTTRRGDAVYPG